VILWRGETEEYSEASKIVDGPYDLSEDPYDEHYLDDLEYYYVEQNPEAESIHLDDMEEDEEDKNEDSDDSGEYVVDRAGNTLWPRNQGDSIEFL
jgi:hypothetical protein